MKEKRAEIHFKDEVDQDSDEPLDTINSQLLTVFSSILHISESGITLDWRDGHTVEIWSVH